MRVSCQIISLVTLLVANSQSVPLNLPTNGLTGVTNNVETLPQVAHLTEVTHLPVVGSLTDGLLGSSGVSSIAQGAHSDINLIAPSSTDLKLAARGFASPLGELPVAGSSIPGIGLISTTIPRGSGSSSGLGGIPALSALPLGQSLPLGNAAGGTIPGVSDLPALSSLPNGSPPVVGSILSAL